MWKGDDHAGFYGENVYSSVQDHNNHLYSQFSTLMRMPFDEGVKYFKDGEVDLLHIDGFHTYDAVKNDFDSWLPKLSSRAVVIIHDSNVRKADFGVYRFVAELRQTYPCFEFSHGHGLTIVGVGAEQSKEMLNLFEADNDERRIRHIQEVFSRLGKSCSNEYAVEAFKKIVADNKNELKVSVNELTELKKTDIEHLSESSVLKSDLKKYQIENERLRFENSQMISDMTSVNELISQRQHEINQILNSTSWRLTLPLRFAKRVIRYVIRRWKRLFLKDVNKKIVTQYLLFHLLILTEYGI
ncbi:hypothetical protein HA45_23900 [Pantoea rodasii]|nr:hypothetical protein HA45_23900 [Pantoea rodasii]